MARRGERGEMEREGERGAPGAQGARRLPTVCPRLPSVFR